MIGGGQPDISFSQQNATCVDAGDCPGGDCETWNDFFPATSCYELEMSMKMPNCWDGVNLDSADHRSHVAYRMFGENRNYLRQVWSTDTC